jgi:mono/diheme cytochrome c family protein
VIATRRLIAAATCVWLAALGAASLRAAPAAASPQQSGGPGTALPATATGEEIFKATCITCHASDGKGSPRSVVGYDQPLPDFTDCAFTTAEADGDWHAVVHEGGRIRGLTRFMPAFGDALTDDQIDKVIGYVRHFCTDSSWPRGDLNFPRAFFTEKAFPENETVWTTSISGGETHSVGNELVYERRLGIRNQFEAVIPIDFQQGTAGDWTRGIGDIAFAFRRTLFSNLGTGTIGAAGVEVALPTGNESLGLGNGFGIYEGFAMAGQALPRNSFLQVHGGFEVPSNSAKGSKEGYLRTAFGTTLLQDRGFGRSWTPQVELLWARPVDGSSEWDIVPQLQVSLSKLQHVLIAVGARVPLNEREERHSQFVTYLLWDWFDGSIFDFWK